MRTDTEQVLRAAKDTGALARLIEQYRPFILREAGIACRRYLTEEDDEWSIALAAFSQAVTEYTPDKGGFPAFARLVIRRRLIDYYRSQKNSRRRSPLPTLFRSRNPARIPTRCPQLWQSVWRSSRRKIPCPTKSGRSAPF